MFIPEMAQDIVLRRFMMIRLVDLWNSVPIIDKDDEAMQIVFTKEELCAYVSQRKGEIGESNPEITQQRTTNHPDKKHVYGRLAELHKLQDFLHKR